MQIRLATESDINQLCRMRYDFTMEYSTDIDADYELFYQECKAFLQEAIAGARWFIWIAEVDEKVVSHIYIQLMDKVPRPGRVTYPFGYVTNVYTQPEYRSRGIGSKISQCIEEWTRANHLEFLIVWPSSESIVFYQRNGFEAAKEPMEKH